MSETPSRRRGKLPAKNKVIRSPGSLYRSRKGQPIVSSGLRVKSTVYLDHISLSLKK